MKRLKTVDAMDEKENDDVSNRVERSAHLANGLVGKETKVFEGLQSLWVTQPLIENSVTNI